MEDSGVKYIEKYLNYQQLVSSCLRFDLSVASKRKKGEKGGKGLRHFSMKVCEKVQKKGTTSYNEVADELVAEFTDPRNMTQSDQVRCPHSQRTVM